jgi:hypothetical protein
MRMDSEGSAARTDLGITNDREGAGDEQAAQIAVPCLLILPSLSLPPLECCFGTNPIQAEKLRPERKALGSVTLIRRGVQNLIDGRRAGARTISHTTYAAELSTASSSSEICG